MHWYLVQVKHSFIFKVVDVLNKNQDIIAFVPKIERWYNLQGNKKYIVENLFHGKYVFIKTSLDFDLFKNIYIDFFKSIDSQLYVLDEEDIVILSSLFNDKGVIVHSIGNIIDKNLICESGPLIGLEENITRIDRHRRLASLSLNMFDQFIKVPLEVVHKT